MSNCRLKYAKDITDNIIKESNLDNTSAIKLKENVNQYLLPIGGKNGKNEKLQTIKNTYEWAKSIQDWANNHYDSKRLGNTVYINDDPQGRGTIVTIMMPKLLIDAYENKFGQMSNEDFNSVLDKKEYYDALDKAAVEDSIKNDKQDTHLREKYFAKNDESPASRILRRISKTSHPLAKLAEKLESYVSINDVTIKLVPKIKYTDESAVNNSAGVYYHNTNSIEIAEYANFPAALAESVLIHEIIHALTVKQLRSNSTVNKDFTELYEYVKTKLPAYNKANNTGTYATTSLDEFMVGIFTDSNFIKQLKDIPPFKGKNKYKNFFEEVFNTILNALGIKTTDNVYEEAFSIASNIIEDARESSLANELYNQSSLSIENEFNSNQYEEPKVDFDLKVVNKVQSNISKINGWFKQMKDTDQFWKKVQSDLAIPKEQVELLRQSEGDTVEQKLVDFVSKYSYTVEVNTAKEKLKPIVEQENITKEIFDSIDVEPEFDGDPESYSYIKETSEAIYYATFNSEGEEYYTKSIKGETNNNSSHYSNLTVPGGTNYTENEISTPGIIPSIKGHARFSTDNGIGWFRSDEQNESNILNSQEEFNKIANSNSALSNVAKILSKYGKGLTTRIVNANLDSGGIAYSNLDAEGNIITDVAIDLDNIKQVIKYRKDKQNFYEEVVLHEEIHRYTQVLWDLKNALIDKTDWKNGLKKAGLTDSEINFIEEVEDLYNQYLENIDNNIDFNQPNSNIKEFITYGLTNPQFIKVLDNIKVKNTPILQKLIDLLNKLFGNSITIKNVLEKSFESFMSNESTIKDSLIQTEYFTQKREATKTRRILEVQSDLFQKGRDRSDVAKVTEEQRETFRKIRDEKSFEEAEKYLDSIKENQFLQLLNKGNNWVTFFVKSIIQDSAKKGYEKVLFPSGNTASKVEGHTTLEEFKKQKENRIKKLEKQRLALEDEAENNTAVDSDGGEYDYTEEFENIDTEIYQLKQELKRIEEEGFGALLPIFKFYEETVTNVLKKQGYNPTQITDEYGNTWNEVVLTEKDLSNILLQTKSKDTVSKKNAQLEQDLKEFATINGIKIEFIDSLVEQFGGDYTAAYDAVNRVVYVNEGKAGIDTLSEEIAHSLTLALGEDNFLVKKAFNLLSRTDYKSTLDPKYVALYKNNETALKHEVIGKMIAKVLVKQYEPKTESEFKLFGAIMQLIDKFISLFKRNDRLEDTIKDLASKITNKEVVAFDEVSKENSVYFQVDTTKVKSKVEDIKEQFVYLKQQLKKNIDKLSSLDKDDPDFPILRDKIKKNKAALEELEATGNKQIVIDLGNELLDNLEIMLNNVEDPDIELKLDNKTIYAAETTFSKLAKVPALAQRAMSLEERLQPIVQEYMVKDINDRATEGREITKEEILGRTSDVSKLTGWFGKLSNSPNYIARTIHQMIKEVQSKVSAKNKENLHSIKEEVEALRQWSKDNGISEEDMYDIFIQEHKNTTVLTRRFTPEFYKEIDAAFKLPKSERYEALSKIGKYESSLNMWIPKNKKYINENYTKIQNTPALKRFYDFHTSLVKEAAEKLPVKINPEFIANISSNSLKDALKSDEDDKFYVVSSDGERGFYSKAKSKQLLEMASNLTGINIKQFKDGTYALDEGLFQDLIPLKFIASMDASKKSKNLGDNLAKFVNFANNYEEMSEILPTIRSMQNQLGKQSFTKSSDPTIAIKGVETNIYKFIDTVIDMQVKGNMKKDELKIKVGTLTDEEGNPIGEKYVHGSKVADFCMKYNSLLRIGLNPINAVTNLLVGDIGNIIEAFGGRFYTLTNLKDASNIFFKDALNEDSDLNHWRDKIGPLQELEDYETVEQVSIGKGINKEKVENFMYMPQKLGETWLQNRTMVAILLKDGYMDSDGKTTEKGKNITETELKRLINKCYEVNNKIHGRYSSRDAAAISQQVLPRMMMQFKKWIPAAIESRFESKHFNVDLGVEVEGRYKTGWRLLKRALEGDLKALQAGNMTELELYNMKKNLAEIVIALAATLSFIAMGAFGDDDEELKKNPYYKFTMDQLDRLSGDLLYFYNPGSYTETVLKPIALAKTTSDVINCVVAFPHIFGLQGKKDVYSSGSRVNENKFIAKLIDITPIASPVAKVARNFKDNKYQKTK